MSAVLPSQTAFGGAYQYQAAGNADPADRFQRIHFGKQSDEKIFLTAEQRLIQAARRYPELLPEERAAVLTRFYTTGDPETLKQIMMPFQPLALAMARKLLYQRRLGSHGKIEAMDLVGAGNEALLKALSREGIKPEKAGKSMVNYITTLYARTMVHYIWRNLRQVPESHNYQVTFIKMFAIAHQFEQKHNRKPTSEEILAIAAEQEMEPRYLSLMEKILKEAPGGNYEKSLDSTMGGDADDRTLAEYVADPTPTPEWLVHQSQERTRLILAMAEGFTHLTPLQQYVFARHYGLWPDKEAMPQSDIAQELMALTHNQRNRESVSSAEQIGLRALGSTFLEKSGLEDDVPQATVFTTLQKILDDIAPEEARSFLPPQDIMLTLVKLGQQFDMKKPMDELRPIEAGDLKKIHPALPKNQTGYMIRYDWTQQFKPKAFNERLVEIQKFLASHADLHLVFQDDLNPFSLDPGNHNRELRMVIFPASEETGRVQVFMEKSEGTGMMREMLKAKLDRYTPEEQIILNRFFDLSETGETMTTQAISSLPEVPYSQAYVSKIKNRIADEVRAEIKRKYPNGSPVWEKAPAGV